MTPLTRARERMCNRCPGNQCVLHRQRKRHQRRYSPSREVTGERVIHPDRQQIEESHQFPVLHGASGCDRHEYARALVAHHHLSANQNLEYAREPGHRAPRRLPNRENARSRPLGSAADTESG